jgi:hypothetical protein
MMILFTLTAQSIRPGTPKLLVGWLYVMSAGFYVNETIYRNGTCVSRSESGGKEVRKGQLTLRDNPRARYGCLR